MHLTEEEIIDYVVMGEATAAGRTHVASCAPCREETDTLREILELTRDLPPPPEGWFDEIWAKVEPQLTPRHSRRRRVRVLRIAAMVVIACIAAPLFWRVGHPPAAISTGAVNLSSELDDNREADRLWFAARSPVYDTREQAIRDLGALGGPRARQHLLQLYSREKDTPTRRIIVLVFFGRSDVTTLRILKATEKDPEMKKLVRYCINEIQGRPDESLANDDTR